MSKAKKPKTPPPFPATPPIPPPAPTPTDISEEAKRKSESQRRKLMAARGRAGTILTGTLGEPNLGMKTLLGE